MGWFDWTPKYKWESEKQTLLDIRKSALGWYRALTEPLLPLLKEIEFGEELQDVELYREIAGKIYEIKVMPGHGDDLYNTIQSMSPEGLLFLTPRKPLITLANDFQNKGIFVKEMANALYRWEASSAQDRDQIRSEVFLSWKEFEIAKDKLVDEVNNQLQSMG